MIGDNCTTCRKNKEAIESKAGARANRSVKAVPDKANG